MSDAITTRRVGRAQRGAVIAVLAESFARDPLFTGMRVAVLYLPVA